MLDEIQRSPDLLSYIQGLVDEDPRPGRWILTGSQNLLLLHSVSQSLAGRTAILHLLPLAFDEIRRFENSPSVLDALILNGGYPRILDRGLPAKDFLDAYIATYLERDVRSVTQVGDLTTFQRFLALCAGRTGQLLNLSSLASDCGISQPTAKAWLSVLETTFITMRLPAWHGNLRKRLVKAPKLHFWDSGLACRLIGIQSVEQLKVHPLRGSIFESWVVSELAKNRWHNGERPRLYHCRTRHGEEVDVVEESGDGSLQLTEIKSGSTVRPDMWRSLETLSGDISQKRPVRLTVYYGGQERQKRTGVDIVPWHLIND